MTFPRRNYLLTPQSQIDWCREQQRAAHEHMRTGHSCAHPQCHPENNLRWLLDAFGEEMALAYPETISGQSCCEGDLE